MVDKDLFLYDLAVVAIMKNEAPYVKEWIDYHLLAGVDHFYIYDNDSTDNQKEVFQPYIDAGIVTYIDYPGQARQYEAYNDAISRFKFECRYMAIIDADEFIFPKSKSTIAEVVDELLSGKPNAASLSMHWRIFGSSGLKNADYTHGVLERFTRRAPDDWYLPPKPPENYFHQGNIYVKSVLNPRMVDYFKDSHLATFFFGCYPIDENGRVTRISISFPASADKIAVNHYQVKSLEEYQSRRPRGDVNKQSKDKYNMNFFNDSDRNEIFDDGIVKYRDKRLINVLPSGGLESLIRSKQVNYRRLINALSQNLFQTTIKGTSLQFFVGKMENFLICLDLLPKLKEKFFEDISVKFFEEAALNAIQKTFYTRLQIQELLLLISEMPKILALPYPAVKNIRDLLVRIIPQMMTTLRVHNRWQDFMELEYKCNLFKNFKF